MKNRPVSDFAIVGATGGMGIIHLQMPDLLAGTILVF